MNPQMLALPAPAWHTDAGDKPEIFSMMREASSSELFALFSEHERFADHLRTSEYVWSADYKIVGSREAWSPVRHMKMAEVDKIQRDAESVTYWLRSELLSRYKSEIEKRQSALRVAAMVRKERAARKRAEKSTLCVAPRLERRAA